jgi:hypothetical protein
MAEISVFTQFQNWMFDGDMRTIISPETMKYNSPINHKYIISTFLLNGPINYYLNSVFNNIGLWYLDKEELLLFVKKAVKDFKINRRSLTYTPWKKTDKLFDSIRGKVPFLKTYEVSFLCELINESESKESIYSSLGLDDLKKKKERKTKSKGDSEQVSSEENKSSDITVEEFIKKNFILNEIKGKN